MSKETSYIIALKHNKTNVKYIVKLINKILMAKNIVFNI